MSSLFPIYNVGYVKKLVPLEYCHIGKKVEYLVVGAANIPWGASNDSHDIILVIKVSVIYSADV